MNRKDELKGIIKIVGAVIMTALIFMFVIGIARVSGNEMYPAFHEGDLCTYLKHGKYQIGDVIVYSIEGEKHFSRIVAVKGDTVSINDGELYINGMKVNEEIYYRTESEFRIEDYKVNGLFVLNDYREDMNDSRSYSEISVSDIDGKVISVMRFRGL